MYMAGLRSPLPPVADTRHTGSCRPWPVQRRYCPLTVNADQSLVCHRNGLLGFEIGELKKAS